MYYLLLATYGLLLALCIELVGTLFVADLHLLTALVIAAPASVGAALELRAKGGRS